METKTKPRGRPRGQSRKKAAASTKTVGYERDERGLLKSVTYQFNEDGSVNWKAMLPPEYLFVNEEWFVAHDEEVPETAEGLSDEQIIVGLAALKEVAKIRGLISSELRVERCDDNYAVCTCKVVFMPNYETNGAPLVYEAVANANSLNVNEFFQMYLETIASNRAFSRAVRNALRIDMVSDTELSGANNNARSLDGGTGVEIWRSLMDKCKEVGEVVSNGETYKINTFNNFKKFLLQRNFDEAKDWDAWDDIPSDKCIKYMSSLKKYKEGLSENNGQ